ncbi:UNVERIFIED_CONTAM: hypothetical protein PYX00_004563 [Menopon gallinae]|uniref:Twinfilin n=1 Tax=Menopon gallinae TaxID=328185 RepID=A0AAW2I4N2_9NEOP
MSHQTGIKANNALKKFFSLCRDGKTRVFKISIENEELVLADYKKVNKTWDSDFEKFVPSLIVEDQPCYILYRLDTKNSSGYDWLLISWTPDTATVRQKMLYASTKATLKQEFGSGDIKDEFHATTLDEVSYSGYMKHKEDMKSPAPLTNREEELKELLKNEIASVSEISIDSKHKTLSGVAFPMSSNATEAVMDIGKGSVDYVQLKIDIEKEQIHLTEACQLKVTELQKKIPTDSARYHLFRFKHTYEGDYMEKIIFIYSMPGYKCPIKERMLYSSCKAPLLESISNLGVQVDKKLEIDGCDEINEDYLMDEVHPKVNLHRPKFEKPKGPPNRGARRITKPQ